MSVKERLARIERDISAAQRDRRMMSEVEIAIFLRSVSDEDLAAMESLFVRVEANPEGSEAIRISECEGMDELLAAARAA